MVVLILISLSDEALGTQGEVATWLPQTCSSWSGLRFWQWPHCVSPCQHSQSCAVTCLSLPAPCPFWCTGDQSHEDRGSDLERRELGSPLGFWCCFCCVSLGL